MGMQILVHNSLETGDDRIRDWRLKRAKGLHKAEDCICPIYYYGVADINISAPVAFNKLQGELVIVAQGWEAVLSGACVVLGGINGGFFVLSPGVIDCVSTDSASWELEPMGKLATEDQLRFRKHRLLATNGNWAIIKHSMSFGPLVLREGKSGDKKRIFLAR